MCAVLYKYRLLIRNGCSFNPTILPNLYTGFVQNTRLSSLLLPAKSYSRTLTQENDSRKHSFTVSYLVESCGLSPESAISASKSVKFESSKNPDLVLSLFRDYGFENAQISKVVSKVPNLLMADPTNTLMPKLDFFRSTLGLWGTQLPRFICARPELFYQNLEDRVVVHYDFLKGIIYGDATKVALVLSRYWRIPGSYVQMHIIPNIEYVRGLGMPQSGILHLVSVYPSVLSQKPELFGEKVKEVTDKGFNLSQMAFATALAAVSKMSKSKWQLKIEVFKRLGWSDEDVNMAFRMNPVCFCLSERKIVNGIDFFVNKMGVKVRDIAKHPYVLTYSLEKRVIPRCWLVRFLQLKGLLSKDVRIDRYLKLSEECFLDHFVIKYQEQVPQLLGLYRGDVNLLELDVEAEGMNLPAFL